MDHIGDQNDKRRQKALPSSIRKLHERKIWERERARTLDPDLGKVALPPSYTPSGDGVAKRAVNGRPTLNADRECQQAECNWATFSRQSDFINKMRERPARNNADKPASTAPKAPGLGTQGTRHAA